jgi:hypothetical protein
VATRFLRRAAVQRYSLLDLPQMLMSLSVAYRSISVSSSSLKASRSRAPNVLFELLDAARADDGRRHPGVPERRGERHLGKGLATLRGKLVSAIEPSRAGT